MKFLIAVFSIFTSSLSFGQTVYSFINELDSAGIVQLVRDLSGEDSTTVNGTRVLITNRASSSGNDIAADYIKERLISYNLDVSDIPFNSNGRNIVSKLTGTINPDSIYLICGHYDAVGNHGADDNASGTAAILEAARVMSQGQFENSVVFALWDEEETGLNGAKDYAQQAFIDGDKILGVLNLDMIGYDGDNDHEFDIDVRDIANSYQMRDDLLQLLIDYDIDLIANIVDPGTPDSDHSAFWNKGYSAVLVGEAWSNNDITPGYHTPNNDRISLFNFGYFYQMVRLATGYIVTKANPAPVTAINNSSSSNTSLAYPNPTKNALTINCDNCKNGHFQIIDVLGVIIDSGSLNLENQINTAHLPSGFYSLLITIDSGFSNKTPFIKE